jgi:glutamyl-tRNA synthetase
MAAADNTAARVVTRFAPSPTGFLHVGGARTALYNWLFARKHGGTFLLRIEDTDQGRHVPEAEQAIFDSLRWLGILWDEGPTGSNPGGPGDGGPNGPYRQSERLDLYNAAFEKLLAEGKAYRCFATPEELDAARRQAEKEKRPYLYDRRGLKLSDAQIKDFLAEGRPHVLRLKMPDKTIVVKDRILGDVVKTPDVLEDFVIRKANGWPTYHFAVVVDDAGMQVSHVIRAQEHLSNTPKHIALQEALGVPTPVYAHIPIVLNANGSKMSKRNKGAKVGDYRGEGFLPEALVNYMALVGWSPGEDRELMAREEMIRLFDIDGINKANGRWDLKKCRNFNARYIRERTAPEALRAVVLDWLGRHVDRWLPAFVTRMETVAEFVETAAPLWVAEYAYEPDAVEKNLTPEAVAQLADTARRLAAADWTLEATHAVLEGVAAEKGLGLGKVAQPVRVALTGKTVSPPVNETLVRLGKDESLRRLARTLARFGGAAGAYSASRLSVRIGRNDDASAYLDQAAKADPGSEVYAAARAMLLADQERFDDAAKAARDLAKKAEGSARGLGLAAAVLMRSAEDVSDAKQRAKAYEEVITLAGKAAEAANGLEADKLAGLVLKAFGLHRIGKDEPAGKVLAGVADRLGAPVPADADAWRDLLGRLGPKLPEE